MYCEKCHHENPDTDVCSKCGQPTTKNCALATASLILGCATFLFGFITGIPGLILGIAALRKIKSSQGMLKGQSLAESGIATSIALPIFGLLLLVMRYPLQVYTLEAPREIPRRNTCNYHMKQLGLGFMQYCQDYNEQMPPKDKWCDAIQPYVRSKNIFECTELSKEKPISPLVFNFAPLIYLSLKESATPPSLNIKRSSYGMNASMNSVKLSSIENPSDIVLLFDAKNIIWNLSGDEDLFYFKHNDGINIGFVDGHVKWYNRLDSLILFKGGS